LKADDDSFGYAALAHLEKNKKKYIFFSIYQNCKLEKNIVCISHAEIKLESVHFLFFASLDFDDSGCILENTRFEGLSLDEYVESAFFHRSLSQAELYTVCTAKKRFIT